MMEGKKLKVKKSINVFMMFMINGKVVNFWATQKGIIPGCLITQTEKIIFANS